MTAPSVYNSLGAAVVLVVLGVTEITSPLLLAPPAVDAFAFNVYLLRVTCCATSPPVLHAAVCRVVDAAESITLRDDCCSVIAYSARGRFGGHCLTPRVKAKRSSSRDQPGSAERRQQEAAHLPTKMGVKRLFEVAGVQVCYNCVLYLLPVIHRTEAIAITTTGTNTDSKSSEADEDKADMLKGLAAGFGFFFGLLILVCLVWCLCCANCCNSNDNPKEKRLKSKVSPSPPRSANIRTRPAATTSSP
ncbi:hypothetical protein V1264_018956 [Littorina saxatilis]|uniref:Uncharacterized protein n=1 Tax=Littorina saxatilis TaxID=31220 RepID=A0AAN9BG96_9CAEN